MLRYFAFIILVLVLTASCGSAAQQQYTSHSVQKGETVYSISKQYNVSEQMIYNLNPTAKDGLKVNSVLILPSKAQQFFDDDGYRKHKVKRQETLYGIAQVYHVSVDDIKKINKELYSRGLKVGEKILIPKTSLETPQVSTEGELIPPGTKNYKVQPKETKFGIARKFNLSIAELESLNPKMGAELKEGSTIVVPEKAILESGEIDSSQFQYYEVLAKEGFYRLKVKFGISESEIIALNPVAKDGLKEGMILKLPRQGSDTPVSELNLEKNISNKKMKTIALMLPFSINTTATDSTRTDMDRIKRDPVLRIALDLYSGALMAAEFAKEKGISVTLNVYDTQKNENTVAALIAKNNIKNADAVIGPLMQKSVERAAAALRSDKTPVFSPLSNRDLKMTPNLFQTIPTDDVLEKTMIRYLQTNSFGKNVIIISDSKRNRQKESILAAIPSAKTLSPRSGGYIQASDVTGIATEGIENWVVLESNDPVIVSSAVNALAGISGGYKIRLFTLNKNSAYEWDEVSSIRLAKLNFTFPSVNRNISEEERQPFLISYKNKYGVEPNRYAIRGFDITYDVLLRLASEKDIYNAVSPENETVYVENKFSYSQTGAEGYCNQAAFILKYNKDLEFELVE